LPKGPEGAKPKDLLLSRYAGRDPASRLPALRSNQKPFSSPTLKSFASFCFGHVLIGGVDCSSGLWGYCAGLPGESAIFGRKDASEKHCGNGRKVALVR
jgi:hypothetical protein